MWDASKDLTGTWVWANLETSWGTNDFSLNVFQFYSIGGFFCPSEVRTCIIFPVSFTCHWARHKEQRLPMLSEAFDSISWLTTATQKTHISHIMRLCRTRLYSMCPSLPPMHANYFWRQSGHIQCLYMCTGAHRPIKTPYTPTGPQMGHSCLVSIGPPPTPRCYYRPNQNRAPLIPVL